jgi:hypothetical protein
MVAFAPEHRGPFADAAGAMVNVSAVAKNSALDPATIRRTILILLGCVGA